jgi:hypothetical protein
LRTMSEMSGAMRKALASADPATIEALEKSVAEQVAPYARDDGSLHMPARTWVAVAEA